MAKEKPSAKKPKPPPIPQGERFKRFAEEHGATEDVLDNAMGEIASARQRQSPPPPKGKPQD